MPLPKIKDAKGAITMQILHQLTIIIHPELLNSLESTVRIENPPYMPLTIENIGLWGLPALSRRGREHPYSRPYSSHHGTTQSRRKKAASDTKDSEPAAKIKSEIGQRLSY
jgi:hypothetical protein